MSTRSEDGLSAMGKALHRNQMPVIGNVHTGNACVHQWVSNSGKGGEPDFRANRQAWSGVKMHVRCSECGGRTWLSPDAWEALAEPAERKEGES